MAEKPPNLPLAEEPAIRQYSLACLLALVVILVLLLEMGLGEWSLFVVALGCICLLLQLRFGPPLFLMSLLCILLAQGGGVGVLELIRSLSQGRSRPARMGTELTLSTVALVVPVLVYLVGSYRLLSLTKNLFPVIPPPRPAYRSFRLLRPRSDSRSDVAPSECRPMTAVEQREIPMLVVSGLAWAVLGWLLWLWLSRQYPLAGFGEVSWRGLILVWLLGMGLVLSSAGLAYLSHALAGTEASAIALQDQLWLETRREQSRLNRWLVGSRLRWQRKEEK